VEAKVPLADTTALLPMIVSVIVSSLLSVPYAPLLSLLELSEFSG
jgi:hypothetical protein